MNTESFVNYLNNPSQLYQLSYEELKSLVLEHPYCQNLWHLLLMKSQLEGHRELTQNLQKAATHSVDRKHLFRMMQAEVDAPLHQEELILEDDALELRDFNAELEPLTETIENQEDIQSTLYLGEQTSDHLADTPNQDETSTADEAFFLPDIDQDGESDSVELELPDLEETIPAEGLAPPPPLPLDQLASHFAGTMTVLENWRHAIMQPAVSLPRPTPKKAFQTYRPNRLQAIQLEEQLSATKKIKPNRKKNKKKKLDPMVAFAEKSLSDSPDFATETLGQLLIDQGLYDKAIAVYQQLIKVNPQKEEDYRKTIEELNNM